MISCAPSLSVSPAVAEAALASGRGVPRGVAVEKPGLGQLAIPPVVRKYRQTGVVPPLLDDARPPGRGFAGAQVADKGHATVVAFHPVAKAVAPVANSAAGHRIVDRGQFFSRRPIEHGQILRPGKNRAGAVHVLNTVIVVGSGSRAKIGASSILGSWCGLARHLRLAVAVEVVHRKLREVRRGGNVRAQVDAPELFASQGVPVQEDMRPHRHRRISQRCNWIPLEHDVVLAIAIEISRAAIVRAERDSVFVLGRWRNRNAQVVLRPGRSRRGLRPFRALDRGGHGVARAAGARRVQVVCAVAHSRHLGTIAVQVVGNIAGRGGVLVAKHAPADVDAAVDFHRHHAAINVLHVEVSQRVRDHATRADNAARIGKASSSRHASRAGDAARTGDAIEATCASDAAGFNPSTGGCAADSRPAGSARSSIGERASCWRCGVFDLHTRRVAGSE